MGLVWSLSALVATFAVLAVFGAIWNKMKQKKDSPLYSLMDKIKRKKDNTFEGLNETTHYRRLSHKAGVKW